MGRPFGVILEGAVYRKLNGLKLAAGQMNETVKRSLIDTKPYSKCTDCGRPLHSTEVYGQWDDYCIDCYIEESSHEK
jgi:hypothetical protein